MPRRTRRVTDRALLDLVKTLPCLVCAASQIQQRTPTDPDHVTTRGAGGDDVPENVWPLCREHHNQRSSPNWSLCRMIREYPVLRTWLELAERHDVLERCARLEI